MSGMDAYYTILGIPQASTTEQIKDAFYKLLAKYRDLTDVEAKKNVKAIVDAYEHLQKCEVVLRPDNTLDMVYEKNGTIKQYNAEGTGVMHEIDKKGNDRQYDENGKPTRIRMKDGSSADYYPNSDKLLKKRDKYGNEILVPEENEVVELDQISNGQKTVKVASQTKVIDDQTKEVPKIFAKWKKQEGIGW